MKDVVLYTDGACSGNPGKGGWAAILFYQGHCKELCGGEQQTTNNRMELSAVLFGLQALTEACHVTVYSDSQYVIDAFAKDWIANWQKNNWRTANHDTVKNQDLWQAIIQQSLRHRVQWVKVKGHSDNEWNNRCDELARGAIDRG